MRAHYGLYSTSQKPGPLTGSAGIPRLMYRQRCSSSRGFAAFGSVTEIDDHKRSATADARGHNRGRRLVASTNTK